MKQRQRVPSGTDAHWSVSKWYIGINSPTALSLNEHTWHEAIFMVEEEKEVLFSLLLQLFYLQIALLFLLFKTLTK
jgi:hypothetical protein